MSDLIKAIEDKLRDRPVGVVGERREFAVLVPLVEGKNSLMFEVRAAGIRQAGDVCFPGGAIEEGETVIEAALREMEEETGIPRDNVRVIGRFDSVLEVNRIRLHTVIGVIPSNYEELLKPDEYEVAEVFTVPIEFFVENEPDCFRAEIIQDDRGFPYEKHNISPQYKWRKAFQDMYFWHYGSHVIWGLTASIMKWFVDKLIDE